jgi:hypothetical protein
MKVGYGSHQQYLQWVTPAQFRFPAKESSFYAKIQEICVLRERGGFREMRKLSLLFVFVLAVGSVSAQSLKPENPYPMKAGINQGISDSLVGIHYWYYYVTPGYNTLKVRFKNPTTLYGATMNTTLTITVSDDKHTWRVTKQVNANSATSEATFTSNKVDKRIRIIVSVAPPNQNLLRMGGGYELEATGAVSFSEATSSLDPIVRTYDPKTSHYQDSYGAVKFSADGTIITANGFTGTWKAFDPENRIYVIQLGKIRYSLQYSPGYGLVRPGEPDVIEFQELRR